MNPSQTSRNPTGPSNALLFDWQEAKGNPSQPPLIRGGAEQAPPCQGGLGGLPLDQLRRQSASKIRQNIPAALLCFLSLAAASTPALAAEDTLGRLIFTPEERAEIDLSRSGKGAVTQIIRSPELTVNGVVFRPGSPTTAWVDGEAVAEAELPAGVRLMRDEQGKLLGLQSDTGRGTGIKRPFGEAFPRPYANRQETAAQ